MFSEKEKKILDRPYCTVMFWLGDFSIWGLDLINSVSGSLKRPLNRLHHWSALNIMKATGAMDKDGNYIPKSERE